MTNKRTDLAAELFEMQPKGTDGLTVENIRSAPLAAQLLRVESDGAGRAIGKPRGRYITLDLRDVWDRREECFQECAAAVADCLSRLLPEELGEVLVVGLGNAAVTPDALGPSAVDHVMVTRHLVQDMPDLFGRMRPVCAVRPGVLGITGVETAEIVRGVVDRVHPTAVIAVDALAARSTDRVLRTVQLTDTGISPGSGVGERRFPLSRESLGVPCIAIGVPTVVDACTLAADVLEERGHAPGEAQDACGRFSSLMVTPRDIDAESAAVAKIIGYGIDLALQPGADCADVTAFLA